jgi:hypothetical protein
MGFPYGLPNRPGIWMDIANVPKAVVRKKSLLRIVIILFLADQYCGWIPRGLFSSISQLQVSF